MRAANCVQFCVNPFCREVHEGCLPDNKNDSDNMYTICSLYQLVLEIERPEQRTTFSFISLTFGSFVGYHVALLIAYCNGI